MGYTRALERETMTADKEYPTPTNDSINELFSLLYATSKAMGTCVGYVPATNARMAIFKNDDGHGYRISYEHEFMDILIQYINPDGVGKADAWIDVKRVPLRQAHLTNKLSAERIFDAIKEYSKTLRKV